MERTYRNTTRVFGVAICLLGMAILATTLARGGGALALGVLVGIAFMVLGAGRAYLAGR